MCAGTIAACVSLPVLATENSAGCEESVRFLLHLDSPSLLDYALSSETAHSVKELICSPEGKQLYQSILRRQQEMQHTIKALISAADFSSSRSFCAITNGFSFSAPLSAKKQLERLSGVGSVTVAGEEKFHPAARTVSDPEDEKETFFGDAYKTTLHPEEAYDAGYTGKNTLIAVIDSEFDMEHEAFSVKPPVITYDRDYVSTINQITPLNIDPKYTLHDLFYNDKIIYAYDYGENDNDCADSENYHGTHVSAIAAGDSGDNSEYHYHGVAYDSQLALFKICNTNGLLKDEAIVAALDDAVKLGPDVINCSFGARKYLQYEYEGKSLYDKLAELDIAVVAAAGNDSFNGSHVGYETIPADYVHYGTIGTPSSMDGLLAVAACQPDGLYQHTASFEFNHELTVPAEMISLYIEGIEELSPLSAERAAGRIRQEDGEEDENDSDYRYLYLNADGSEESLRGVKLNGEYLILNRGSVPFEDMLKNAILHGCIGLAVIDNDQPITYDTDHEGDTALFLLPSSQRAYLEAHPKGVLKVNIEETLVQNDNPRKGRMTDFSSMGVRSDLTLKPDIAAPGDMILSAAYEDRYMEMSGTSMATPCMAGVYAIMKQYLDETDAADAFDAASTVELIYQLLMSTADPLVAENSSENTPKTYYSPRSQGAGAVNLGKAIHTRIYLSVDDHRPKVSLKDNPDGIYQFSFQLNSFSERPILYQLDMALQTDGYQTETDKKTQQTYLANTLKPVSILDRAQVSYYVNGEAVQEVVVQPDETVTVSVSLRLDPSFIRENTAVFTNGFFVDGFVFLRSEEEPSLSLPFAGFCGDWEKAPVFTANAYDQQTQFPDLKGGLSAGVLLDDSIIPLPLGVNGLGYEELPSEISFGVNSVRNYTLRNPDLPPAMLLPDLDLMRDTMDYTISLTDTAGELLYRQNFGSIPSNFRLDYRPVNEFGDMAFRSFLEDYQDFCDSLFESRYTYTVTASVVGSNGNPGRSETRSFSVRVDNTAPIITDALLEKQEDGRLTLTVTAFDEGCLQGIELFAVKLDKDGDIENRVSVLSDLKSYRKDQPLYTVDVDPESHYDTFVFDVTEYEDFIKYQKEHTNDVYIDDNITIEFEGETEYENVSPSLLCLRAVDYAYNTSEMELIDVGNYGVMELQFLDEHGNAPYHLKVKLDGQQFVTDKNGKLTLYNLSMGIKKLTVESEEYELDENSDLVLLSLTPGRFRLAATIRLREIQHPMPIPQKQPDQKKDDRPLSPQRITPERTVIFPKTGSASNDIILTGGFLLLSLGAGIFLLLSRKKQ